ncbi:MAG TPA: protein kinase [Noviherbaspirillum sp.]|uniref:serine/threonine protein kinase n=1 Tax=Noviherbaspirillum sp. TaxID=1926288 RepID=UPI002B49DAE2|nr:protein kinase [Noviherbaspirillum sp.]HJV88613.1 protein kinase [Noviherbaspirillum sp.]
MASLGHAIHSFQNGRLSHKEFFAQVDRVLGSDDTSPAHLLQLLDDEHTRVQLPPDVYAELARRVERLLEEKQKTGTTETRMQTRLDERVTSPSMRNLERDLNEEPARMKGVGDTLNGRFVLEECIGFGGMGTVYKALDLRKLEASDRKPYVAIKVLNVQFRGHPKSLIALQREARKAQTLAHPNIVAVYDFDRDGSTVYLTMECLSGKPLSRLLRAPGFTGMPLRDAMRIIQGMGKALSYAHERGFVHCDFKPANVILTDSGEVKVIDFGIARVFQKPEEEVEATVFDPGSLGALTPAYASPEMIEHRVPDPRDDVYALACITYELLTGHHPFDRMSATQARNTGMRAQRPKNLGHFQWRALKAALSFERETRTPTVARFLQGMSGEQHIARYAAMAGSTLAAAIVIALGINYFWKPASTLPEESALPPATSSGGPTTEPQAASGSGPPPAPAVEAPLTLAAVTPVLSGVPCSALAPSVQGNTLDVQGYIAKSYGSARLKETLNGIPGVKDLKLDVRQVGDAECGVISALGPYWVKTSQAGGATAIHTRALNAELKEGDPLVLDIATPGYDSYVYVDYYVLDGSVAHLLPNPRSRDNQAPANYKATIGSLGNWVISKPFGNELIVLLVTPAPLFDGVRPISETRADYLRLVEKQLGKIAGKYGRDKIAVDFVQITTRAR